MNLADWALPDAVNPDARPPVVIAVLGSSMDTGKTTMAAYLTRGLRRAGLKPGYAKLTGTGAGGDLWLAADAGADPVVDFTDAGFASTYRVSVHDIERVSRTLLSHLAEAGVDVAIVEVADGLLQPETAAVLESEWFRARTDAVLFAAGDALAAAAGVTLLGEQGLRPLAVGGQLTTAPLQCRETLSATHLPVMSSLELADPATAQKLADQARAGRPVA